MYCKNCGNQIDDKAVICVKCGYAKGTGDRYCINCGTEIPLGATVCVQCGFSAQNNTGIGISGAKSKTLAGILGIVSGFLGIHNFYLGYTMKAIIQLCVTIGSVMVSIITCGLLSFLIPVAVGSMWIWGIVEGIMILTGKILTDGKGNLLIE